MSEKTAITIGNFDGVHLGHQSLINEGYRAVPGVTRVVALSFDPHPMTALNPAHAPARLSLFEQRREWVSAIRGAELVRMEPTAEFLAQSPQQFIEFVTDRFRPAAIVEGADFRFGKARAGTIQTLREFESKYNFKTIVADSVETTLGDQSVVRVSSSLIRWLVARGRVADAATMLGRPFEMRCRVTQGDKRGRTIGFPTVNLQAEDFQMPGDGIYAGMAVVPDGRRFPAAISVGTKPTFGDHPRVCEAHLIGFDGPVDEYGWTVQLAFHHWLRDQLVYPAIAPLIEQLHRDVERTLKLVGMTDQFTSTPRKRLERQRIA